MSDLADIRVTLVEHHFVFEPEPRSFDIKTSVEGSKADAATIYSRIDYMLEALNQTLPDTMAESSAVEFEVRYETPKLDHLRESFRAKRPKLMPRWY